MTEELKVGDVVTLMSGGPEMTVTEIRPVMQFSPTGALHPTEEVRAVVEWWTGERFNSATFPVLALDRRRSAVG